jgi:hypothetical protein
MLRQSEKEIWQLFCKEVQGEFLANVGSEEIKIKTKVDKWDGIFDVYSTLGLHGNTLTRVRVPFISKTRLRCTLYQQDIFSEIGKFFGMQDIVVGDQELDPIFVIKGNNEKEIKALFGNHEIAQLLASQPNIYLEIRDYHDHLESKIHSSIDELYLHIVGVSSDIKQLRLFHLLFQKMLNELCFIGVAAKEIPTIIF